MRDGMEYIRVRRFAVARKSLLRSKICLFVAYSEAEL